MKQVVGYEGYLVDESGNVYSHKRKCVVLMKHSLDLSGYPFYRFYADGKQHRYAAHRVVWEAFHGKPSPGLQVDHIDNDRLNYKLVNLQLLTRRQNAQKSWTEGRSHFPEGFHRKGGLARAKVLEQWRCKSRATI